MKKTLLTLFTLSMLTVMAVAQSYNYRYWVDSNAATSGSATGQKTFEVEISSLSNGIHALHVQALKGGTWSSVRTRYFLINHVQTDGYSVRLSIDDGAATTYELDGNPIEIDIESLAVGSHVLYATLLDADNNVVKQTTHEFEKEVEVILISGISFHASTMSLTVGESRTITATLTPENATNKNMQWTSSNTAVATVENGEVTAVAVGTATITATATDGSNVSSICNITVTESSATIEATDISQMDNVVYIESFEDSPGTTELELSIKMKNSAAIRGFQFDLVLPEGVTPFIEDNEMVYWLNGDRAPKKSNGQFYHSLEVSEQADGSYQFLSGSTQNKTFKGNDGEVVVVMVNIADNIQEDDYPIILKNIKLTETDISNYYQTEEVVSKLTIVEYEIGDISGDGVVDVSDYIGVANHILGNTPAGFNARAADVNKDNAIDVSDYIGIANIILTGSIYGNTNASSRAVSLPKQEAQERDPE